MTPGLGVVQRVASTHGQRTTEGSTSRQPAASEHVRAKGSTCAALQMTDAEATRLLALATGDRRAPVRGEDKALEEPSHAEVADAV